MVAVITLFIRSAKRDSRITRRPDKLAIRGNCFDVCDCFTNRNGNDIARLQRDHDASFVVCECSHGTRPIVGCQHAIKSIWPATALQVAQHYTAGLSASQDLQFTLTIYADSSQTRGVFLASFVLIDLLATQLNRPFSNNDDTKIRSGFVPSANLLRHRLDCEGNFRNQNYIGASGNARMQCDPAGVPAHYFQDHHSLVRFRRGMKSIKSFRGNVQRSDKTESKFRACQIVIDGFWHSANRNSPSVKLFSDCQRAFAAEHDECINAQTVEIRDRLRVNSFRFYRHTISGVLNKSSSIACSEDGTTTRQQAPHLSRAQRTCLSVTEQAFEAVFDADDFHAVFACGCLHNGAYHGVQPWSITSTR